MAGFKMPLDAKILALPITYAVLAFSTMVGRILTVDPEYKHKENANIYYDSQESVTDAEFYNHQLRDIFKEEVKNRQFGVFQNIFGNSPQ